MKKIDELKQGCMAKAFEDEMTFVLLARDKVAPSVIRFWAHERIAFGLNDPGDPQIAEALECAHAMETQRDEIRKRREQPHED